MKKEDNFIERTRTLLKAVEGEINDETTSEEECDSYVIQLYDLKEDLSEEEN